MVENIYMQLYILLIVTNISLWIRANGTIIINTVWFHVARKCLNTMSANPVGYVARKFIDKFRVMVPNQMFQWTIVIVINQSSQFKSCFKIYIIHVRQLGYAYWESHISTFEILIM